MKSTAAGAIATKPAKTKRIPPIIQPAPKDQPSVLLNSLTDQKTALEIKAKTPATINKPTAMRFNKPANLSIALTLSNGKTIPAIKISKASKTKIPRLINYFAMILVIETQFRGE